MGVKWRDFQMPKRLDCDEATYTDTYGKFIAEPFERGYGITLGNSLRRALLSSIEGSAVTSIKVEGAPHEYSTIPGVMESVSEIILNLKRLVLRSHSKVPKPIYIKVDKKGEVTAADIICDETVEILNPGLHIATLSRDASFSIEMEVSRGRGYVPAELNKKDATVGTIPIDSIFTPITRVKFDVENTRVGQKTDYDCLLIEIWTNGSINPKEAILYSANILQRHLDIFVSYGQLPEEEEEEEEVSAEEQSLYEKLRLPISELELSVRSANCLKDANIKTIAELVKKTESELLTFRNFGKKSLTEINDLLKVMGINLGMKVDAKKLRKKD
ncbi:MAG: DNA-directed RNA polymerase subunit alpha [Omnitrophica WOR_2 bacterium GWF2_38_59]|nr:MAG: DNA-directed RNA polymerase subunit alpha [Omnitrophica WOR_2 bacterium GWA2_37_7]OGX25217.1 MAG: DNA-directed RNA polymerase subunit alpha [Omnitrophica WOR_2 bacterium GWF2_38_59]OGX47889.1 MAG: DNA-directed RNA polymerase subunit alpha [Omnitrophica WOR_2 bacterium RIFOXYA2_FULL_38_17]OGX53543.1 MAG: DNA-directed RNA polymerase subunit alpha [Omnitrophica WOR_2 bacterium RIFOXYA12_FULL_38_10]OGX56226.1 MAG: DNA-directed RNA polymerase subunit alpha [Omnitrophica WOR_2 bacterium RIFOX